MDKSSTISSTSSSSNSLHKKNEITKPSNIEKHKNSSESSFESNLTNEIPRHLPSKIRYAKKLTECQTISKYTSKQSLIEDEIDEFPFEFRKISKQSKTSESNDDQDQTMDRVHVTSDEEFYTIDDIFKYQQLPNMSDFWEGFIGFLLTALSVSILIIFSFMIVLAVDILTARLVTYKGF